jgi:predicted nucleic acid-binding protein
MTRFIDTNVFIYAITAHPRFGETAKHILKRVEKGEPAATSTLVLCEVAWVLEAMGKQGEIKTTLEKILSYKNLRVIEFDDDDLLVGANNMISHRLDFNDAVNVAVMMRSNISEVYSNDNKHLGRLDFLQLTFS